MRLTGFALALLPLAYWSWTLRHPCGLQGEAWRECRAHHQSPHAGDDDAPVAGAERAA